MHLAVRGRVADGAKMLQRQVQCFPMPGLQKWPAGGVSFDSLLLEDVVSIGLADGLLVDLSAAGLLDWCTMGVACCSFLLNDLSWA